MTIEEPNTVTQNFLSGGGKMGELMRTMDWSRSTLGDPGQWSQSLRTYVSICLNSRFPLLIWWGNDLVKIYNDAYRELIAAKHPKAMGAKGADVWPEIWHIVGPMLQGVLNTGEATWSEDQQLIIQRNGYPEECYFTYSYSAIRDETGKIGGVFCAINETTKKVFTERHLAKQLNNLLIQAPVAICILHGENYVIEVINERMAEMWDRKMEDVLNKPAFDVLPELRDQGFKELLDNVYNKGERFVTQELPITLNRHEKIENAFLKLVYEPLREENGTISGVMVLAHDITEQVNARKIIEDSNKRYHRMLKESPFAFSIMKGKDMVITMANDLIKYFWGKGEDVEGKTLLELLPELADQPFPALMDNVYTTGVPSSLNEILTRLERSGKMEDHYFNIVCQPYYEADETISGVTTIAYEVTEMVFARKKAEENEHRYRTLIEKSSVATCLFFGEEFSIQYANDLFIAGWGKNKTILGKTIMEALPELTGQPFLSYLESVYTSGKTHTGVEEKAELIVDGKLQAFYFNYTLKALRDNEGKIYGIHNMATDVTDQVLAKNALEKSELHFRQMSDLMPAKITNADTAGGVTYYNKNWLDYTGMSFEELENFGYYNIMHPDELEEFKNRFQKAAETGTDLEMEMRFMNKEGEYLWHLNRASPVKDENGNITMWIGVTTEIQKMKEEEKLKDNFLSMASHELKTPVTTIKAYGQIAEMMLQKKGDVETLAMVNKMSTQVDKLNNLIVDLLDFTKIRDGKLIYNEAFFDFNEFVKEVIVDMQSTSTTHKIENMEGENVQIFGDRDKLSQVLNNLISNAIKYSPKADKIVVSTRLQKDGIDVRIQDFGIGISAEAQHKVFEQFYRVTADNLTTFPGMGIGLYISSEIIKRQGGKIWVESTDDKGSVFCIWLPFDHRERTS